MLTCTVSDNSVQGICGPLGYTGKRKGDRLPFGRTPLWIFFHLGYLKTQVRRGYNLALSCVTNVGVT